MDISLNSNLLDVISDAGITVEWVDCKTGKPCGRRKGEKRKGYPACRPTMAQCTSAMKKKTSSKRISWK